MTESDGIEEALTAGMRMAMAGASRVGETLARVRQEQHAKAAAASEAAGEQLLRQRDAAMQTARTEYTGIDTAQWWEQADVEEIAATYTTAAAWKDLDPTAAQAEERMASEVRERYGVDVRQTDPRDVGPRLDEAARKLAAEPAKSEAESAAALAAAELADQQNTPVDEPEQNEAREAEVLEYDSPERRQRDAATLRGHGVAVDVVEAKQLADTSNAEPATEATRSDRRAAKARRGRSHGAGREQQYSRGL